MDGNTVRLSPGLFQPIAADDVAPIAAEVALAAPQNGIVEIVDPERVPFYQIVARSLKAVGDPRPARGDGRPRGPIFRPSSRRALACAVGRSAPRPHRSRQLAPPVTDKRLIPYP